MRKIRSKRKTYHDRRVFPKRRRTKCSTRSSNDKHVDYTESAIPDSLLDGYIDVETKDDKGKDWAHQNILLKNNLLLTKNTLIGICLHRSLL